MKEFYEKAEETILAECRKFVKDKASLKGEYNVFKEALNLSVKLRDSLIESHKEFDEAIQSEAEQIIRLEESPEKEAKIIKFNQKNYCLYLNVDAHNILEQLETIYKNNWRK